MYDSDHTCYRKPHIIYLKESYIPQAENPEMFDLIINYLKIRVQSKYNTILLNKFNGTSDTKKPITTLIFYTSCFI